MTVTDNNSVCFGKSYIFLYLLRIMGNLSPCTIQYNFTLKLDAGLLHYVVTVFQNCFRLLLLPFYILFLHGLNVPCLVSLIYKYIAEMGNIYHNI